MTCGNLCSGYGVVNVLPVSI